MAIARPISPSLDNSIRQVLEAKYSVDEVTLQNKPSGGGKVVVHAKIQDLAPGKQDPYFSVTHEETEPRRRSPSSFGIASTKHVRVAAHDKDDVHHLMNVHKMHLKSAITGAPMHAQANAEYHAGIGQYAQENHAHLASHLGVSDEHVRDIMNEVHAANSEESKKQVIAKHIAALKPKWKKDAEIAKQSIEHLEQKHGAK